MKLGLHNHLCFRLYVASRLVIQTYNEEFEALGLTYLKYLVLMALKEQKELKVNELGEILHLDSGTLSPLLKSLEKSGYIVRERLSHDSRQVVNRLTPEGHDICEKAYKIAYRLFKETGLKEKAFFTLIEKTDDFIGRCKRILFKKTIKETPWKTNYSPSAYSSQA